VTADEAIRELAAWAELHRSRDDLIRAAIAAGVTKHKIHVLTGIARTTIDRIHKTQQKGTDREK